ncbi:5'-nucleotidase C-terminal domain-containing protein [Paenibacillus sp. VCA1]|nr:5'-nucleotidase C-terminal domain-containing protein [Paenibacillus sp. VCA1]MDR9853485.1 5'-nucleotidase C-terminal domain-containing protein [Paenibacillus sp. VCA1]
MFNIKSRFKRLAGFALASVLTVSAAAGLQPASAKAEADQETHITLLATSDVHGRFMPWDYAMDTANTNGSFTQLYTLIKKVRAENPNTILLDAGDVIQDNSAELFNDQPKSPMMVAMNEMGYDAWAMGNHEFNFGLDTFDKITGQFKAAKLAGNVYKENGERFLPATTIIDRGGIKVGIIGMTTPLITDFEKDTDHLKGLVVKNPIDETKKAVKELEGKVDVIIGLMHMGLDNENALPGTGVTDIANEVPELTAIFAGHMHTLVKSATVNGVLIGEPDKYGTHVSRIDLTFVNKDGKMVLKDKTATAIPVKGEDGTPAVSDPDLEKELLPYHEFARKDANIVVGELVGKHNMVPENEIKGIPAVQVQETPLSDFFSEVMLHYSKADVVAHQIDNDKARLDVGPIRKKDIAYNYQFALGEVTNYKVTGKDLKDYMEWAVGYFNSTRPGDVTVSFDKKRRSSKYSTNDFFGGVKYDIDLSQPYGSRIANLRRMDGTPIQMNDTLTLGMNSYRMDALVAKGGALEGRKFEKLWTSKAESAYGETGGTIRNLAIRYLKEVMNGKYEAKLQNNWKIVGVDTNSKERADVVELINAGILTVPATEDGKYTNIASINILDPVKAEDVTLLAEKAGVDAALLTGVKTNGELYHELNEARKGAAKPEQPVEKPDKPEKPEAEKPSTKPEEKPDPAKPANPEKPANPAPKPSSGKQAKITADYLNIRAGASAKAKILGAAPKGTVLEVTGTAPYGWVKVVYQGKTAFVYGKYVTIL